MARLKIEVNDVQNIQDLLQEAYRHADEQIIQAQNEINKLANSTKLGDEFMDAKGKYAKAMNDYMAVKDKAIAKKIDVAKILAELYHHHIDKEGNTEAAKVATTFNIDDIKAIVDSNLDKETEEIKKVELKK